MGELRKRLRRLEEQARERGQEGRPSTPPYLSLYLKELENEEREEQGLDPLPLTPEEQAIADDPEFDAWWGDFEAAHADGRRPSEEEHRDLEERWHRMRREKYGIPRRNA